MKIAFVSLMSGASWGGSESLWRNTALYALRKGHKVFVSVYDWGSLPLQVLDLKDNGAMVHLRNRFDPTASLIKKIISYIKNRDVFINSDYTPIFKFKPDVMLINQGGNFDLAMHHKHLAFLLNKSGLRYLLMCHSHIPYSGIPELHMYPAAVPVFQQAARVLFVSKKMRQTTERQLCCKLSNAAIVQNPLGIDRIDVLEWPGTKTMQFAIVGNLSGAKGQDVALEVLADDAWKSRDWQLNLYGAGNGERYLHDLCAYYGLQNKVVFHGHVSSVSTIWQHNHLMLLPSAGEGLPISLIEAMACGRTAVVTDVGGNTEVITEPQTGYVAEAPSASSFGKALERAWQNKNAWKDVGKRAHEFAVRWVDPDPEKTLFNYLIG